MLSDPTDEFQDKNKAPSASDAFKAVSASYLCLTDEKRRKLYDEYGHEDQQHQARHEGLDIMHHYDMVQRTNSTLPTIYRPRSCSACSSVTPV